MAPPVVPVDDVEAAGGVDPESSSGEPPCLTGPAVALVVCVGLTFAVLLSSLLFISVSAELQKGAKFYAGVTMVDGMFDADQSQNPEPAATSSFNLTLRVDNRRGDDETCTGDAAVRILYAGLDVGWGAVPGLCVPRRATGAVEVILSHPGVVLCPGLRDRMASDKRAGGRLGFRVEMEMIVVGTDQSSRSKLCLLRCDVKQGVRFATSPCDRLYQL